MTRLDVRHAHLELMPGVELYVYALKGDRYSVMFDTGIASMKAAVLTLASDVAPLAYVLHTHVHADHIGCNRAVADATGARFAVAGAESWLEDNITHYEEFCRTDVLPDSEAQRDEIMGLIGPPVRADLTLGDNTVFHLGEGADLLTLRFPGHKLEEVGFLEINSGTLFLGDLLLALAAPFFHGFQTAAGFRSSLAKLEGLVGRGEVSRVLSSHHHPLGPEQTLAATQATRGFLDDVEAATLEAATGVSFDHLWRAVCSAMNKELEFRGYAMLEVQVRELCAAGRMRAQDNRLFTC